MAPNYAGYDSSRLSFHPFLNADQQSKEMMDTLSAARMALPGLLQPVQDNGKLLSLVIQKAGMWQWPRTKPCRQQAKR